MQRYELHKFQISDDFVYWFRNGKDIFQAVFREKSLKMFVLYWRVPYIYTIYGEQPELILWCKPLFVTNLSIATDSGSL